ncbi:MAG TPA: DUF1461 domain-containing protein [Coriobacteriia bacterium]
MTPHPGQRLEAVSAGVAWAALVVGLSVTVLTVPVFTSAASQALGIPASAGLSVEDTVHLSGLVRAFVADQDPEALPPEWRGSPAFDAGSVSHLVDVRRAIAGGRLGTGIAAGLLAVYLAACVSLRRWDVFASGMRTGAIVVLALFGIALVAGLTDFGSFFAAFHGLFFKAGTWTFPYDSMLIRLFPLRFWVTSGAAWAALAGFGAAVLALAARYVPRAVRQVRGSRNPEDV